MQISGLRCNPGFRVHQDHDGLGLSVDPTFYRRATPLCCCCLAEPRPQRAEFDRFAAFSERWAAISVRRGLAKGREGRPGRAIGGARVDRRARPGS